MSGLTSRDEGAVRVLTLSRPPGNTLSIETLRSLRAEAEAAGREGGPRAVVIAAEGRYFSSGLDLDEMAALPEPRRGEPFESLIAAYRALLSCPRPVVGALSGSALLGGWILAMGCDWRLLARGAKVSLAEVRAALTPTSGLLARMAALSRDPRVVKEMVLRGTPIAAEQAEAAGLVDELLDEAEVLPSALALARRLAKSPPRAFGEIKRALNAPLASAALWEPALAEFRAVFSGEEAREGVEALRAKRRPRWEA